MKKIIVNVLALIGAAALTVGVTAYVTTNAKASTVALGNGTNEVVKVAHADIIFSEPSGIHTAYGYWVKEKPGAPSRLVVIHTSGGVAISND